MRTIDKDRAELKRLVESYGKRDVLNYVNHLDEGIGSFMRRTFAGKSIEEQVKAIETALSTYHKLYMKRFLNITPKGKETFRREYDALADIERRIKRGEKVQEEEIQQHKDILDKYFGLGAFAKSSSEKAAMATENLERLKDEAFSNYCWILKTTNLGDDHEKYELERYN
jgi:hypothetical protein